MEENADSKEDSKINDIVVHLQQLLVSDNVLPSSKNPLDVFESQSQNVSRTTRTLSSDDYLDQLAPIILDALANNQTDELRSGIDMITKSKDQEIENLCNGNQNVRFSRGL